MRKYREQLSEEQKKDLKRLSTIESFSGYNEPDIREDFITPLLKLLGYDKETDYEMKREGSVSLNKMRLSKNDSTDLYLNIGRSRVKLDYICNIRKKNFWIIEAKSGKSQEIAPEEIDQAYLYTLHPDINCRFFAVTNGWYFNLYDRNRFLSQDNANIMEPILSIKHTELYDKFELLYDFLGAPEITFNVKEDIILNDIKNTLSSEVYIERLSQFENKVRRTIQFAAQQVYANQHDIVNEDVQKYKDDLKSLIKDYNSISQLLSQSFKYPFNFTDYDNIYDPILKEALLYAQKAMWVNIFFNHLFIDFHSNTKLFRVESLNYFSNIVIFLISLCRDENFNNLECQYNKKKYTPTEVLEQYLLDMFNFFEQNQYIKLNIILFPMIDRIVKLHLVYNDDNFKHYIEQKIHEAEFLLAEEELAGKHLKNNIATNEGLKHTLIILQQVVSSLYDYNSRQFDTICINNTLTDCISVNLCPPYEYRHTPEDFQQRLSKMGLLEIGRNIDQYWNNPWCLLFNSVYRIIKVTHYKIQNEELKIRIEYLKSIGFIHSTSGEAPVDGAENIRNEMIEKARIFDNSN